VGRDTPANTVTSFFKRPSAHHNTIRARVATVAGVSALFTSQQHRKGWENEIAVASDARGG
jgi:hypothetical protein